MKKIYYNIAGIFILLFTILGVYIFFQVKGKEEYNTILTIEKNQPLSTTSKFR